MKKGKILILLAFAFGMISCSGYGRRIKNSTTKNTLVWKTNELKQHFPDGFLMLGDPKVVSSPMGKALHFNGKDEAFFYKKNPLDGLRQFTIEVVMKPDSNGPFAQRFFHLGKTNGRRVLMEIRNKGNKWYFDAFLNSVTNLTLVDSSKTHPTDRWYDVAFVVDNGKMDTYVNGKHELSGRVKFNPFTNGQASLGVRMNQAYWFKGAIYMVRITPKILKPQNFINIKQEK